MSDLDNLEKLLSEVAIIIKKIIKDKPHPSEKVPHILQYGTEDLEGLRITKAYPLEIRIHISFDTE